MIASFLHPAILQHNDYVAIINCSESVSNENTCASLIFQYTIYVLQQTLLRLGI